MFPARFRVSVLAWPPLIVGACVCHGAPLTQGAPDAAPPTPAGFAQHPNYTQVTVSPDGKYLAMVVRDNDDNATLTVLDAASAKPVAGLNLLEMQRGIGSYVWDSPTRIVISLLYNDDITAGGEAIGGTGELMSLDVPTNAPTYLVGPMLGSETSAGQFAPHHSSSLFTGYGYVLAATPEIPDSVVIYAGVRGRHGNTRAQVMNLNTRTGAYAPVAAGPGGPGVSTDFLTDQQGNLRYATLDDDSREQIQNFRRTADGTDWVAAKDLDARNLYPQWITRDGVWTYFTADDGRLPGRFCVSRQHTDGSGPLEEVTCQDGAEYLDLIKARDGNSVIATYAEPGMPALKPLVDNADTRLLLGLQATLGDSLVFPVSKTLDGSLWLLKAQSDRNPGAYYLCERGTQKCEDLLHAYDNLPLGAMRPTRAVRYAARDGLTIHGFLTLPASSPDGRKPPLVVIPHGGPIQGRDDWFYDQETQLLATHGYAVLRVNFRGSPGYGAAFVKTAKRQWGKALINDITDGTRHVIGAGLVDPNRVGIYGASYGGYAALMSGVREPDLYKAVVTYAGVADLVQQTADTDTSDSDQGVIYLGKYIGDDPAELKAQSPMTYIDRLKAPVMIAHGMEDKRVRYNQAQALRAALDARHHAYEWFVRPQEGHGFSRLENRQAFNEALLAFLDKNLKGPPPP